MDTDFVADSDNELVIEDDEFEQPGTLRRGKSFRQYLDDPHEEIVLTQTETEDSDNDASQPSTARLLKKADSLEEFENLEREAGAEQDSQLGRVGVAETPTSYLRTLQDAQQASNAAQSAKPNASAPATSGHVPTPGAQRPPSTSLLRKQELIEELQLESEIQQLTEPHRVPGAADRASQSGAASKTPGATNRDTRTPFAHSASAIAAALRDSVHDELMMEAAAQLDDEDEPAPFVNADDGLVVPSDEQLEQFDEKSDSPAQEVSEVVGDAAQFDADGNILQFDADGNILQFDAEGNVVQFDADGNMVQFDADGNVVQFDADGNVVQFDADGNVVQFDADGNVVQFDADGNPVQPEGTEAVGYINEEGYYVAPDGNVYEVQKGEDGQLYYGELVGTVNGEEVYVGPEGDQQPEIPTVPEEDEDTDHAAQDQDADAQQRVDPIELHDKLQHVIEEYYQSGRLERIGSEELVTRSDSPFVNTHATLVEEHEAPAASRPDEPSNKRAKAAETPLKREPAPAVQPQRTRPRADSGSSSDDADTRIKEEQKALFRTLQNDYNRLLTKYALAEVTIDQLRLGAHVKLDYSVSQPPAPPAQPLLRQLRIDPARQPPSDPRRAGATSAYAELMLSSLNAELDVLSAGGTSQDPSRNAAEEKRAYSALDPRLLSQYAELFGLAHLAQPADQFAQLNEGDERFYTAPNQLPPNNALAQVQVAALLARTPTQLASEFDESVEAPSHLPQGTQRAPSRGYQVRPATSTQNFTDSNSLLAVRRPSGYDLHADPQDVLMDTEVPLIASKRRTVSMDAGASWPHSGSFRPNADSADSQQTPLLGGPRPSLGNAAGPLLPSLLSAVASMPSSMQNLQFNALDPTRHVSITSAAPENTSRNAQLQQRIVEQESSKLQLAQLAERLQNDIDQLQTGLDAEQIDVDVQEELCANIKQQYDELQERYKHLRDVDSELKKQQVLLEEVLPSAEANTVTQTSFVNLATGRSANGGTGNSAAINPEVKLEEALFNISLKLDDVNQRVDTNVKRANRRVPFQVVHNTNVLASGGQKLSNLGSVGTLPSLFNARKTSTPGVRRPPSQTGSILLDASGMLLDEASQFDPELNQKLAQLEDEYVALMNHYTVIKQMPRTPQRDGEIESLMRRLEDIANEAKASPVPLGDMGSVNTLAQMQAAGSSATLPALPRSNVGGSLTSLPNGETPNGSGYDLRGNEPPSRPLTTTALERDSESEAPLFNSTMIGVSAPNLSNLARAVPSSPSTSRGQQASRIPRRGSQGTPVQQLRSELDALVERPATLEFDSQLNMLQSASQGESPVPADFPADSANRNTSNARLQAARHGSANQHLSPATNRSHSAGVLLHGQKTDSQQPESDAGSDIFRAAQELLLDTDTLNSARSDVDPYADSDTRTSQAHVKSTDWPHQNPDYSYQYSYDQSEIMDDPPYAHFAQFDNDSNQAPQQNRSDNHRNTVAQPLNSKFRRAADADVDANNDFDVELENIDLGTEDQEQLRMIEEEIQSAREPTFGAGQHTNYGHGPFDKQRHLHSANQMYTDESGFIGSESANSAMTASLLSAPAANANAGHRAGAASRGNQPASQPASAGAGAAGQTPAATRGQSTPSGRRSNDAGASHPVATQPDLGATLRPSEQLPASSTQSQRRTPMNGPGRSDQNAGRRTAATPSSVQGANGGSQNVASRAHQSPKANERAQGQAASTPSTKAGGETSAAAGRTQGLAPRARQSPLTSGAPTPTLSDARVGNAPPAGTSRTTNTKAHPTGPTRDGNTQAAGGISRSGNLQSAGASRDGKSPSTGVARAGNAPSAGITSSSSARQPAKAPKSDQPATATSATSDRPFVLDGHVHARDDDSYSDSYSSTVTSSSRSVSTDSLTVSEPELAANSRPRATVSADRQTSNDRSASKGLPDMVRQQSRSATHPDVSAAAVTRNDALRQPPASRQPATPADREPQRDRNLVDRAKSAAAKGQSVKNAPLRRASPDDTPPPVPPRPNRPDSQPLQNSNSRERTSRLTVPRPEEVPSKMAPPRGGTPLKATLPIASALVDQNAWDPALRRSTSRSFATASPCPTCGSLRHSPDVSTHRHGAHSRPLDGRRSDSFSESGSDASRSAPGHARYRRNNDDDRLGHSSRPLRGRSRSRNVKDHTLDARSEHSSASPKRSGSTARSPKRDQRSDANKRAQSVSRNTHSPSAFEPEDDVRKLEYPKDALASAARRYPGAQSARPEQRPDGLESLGTSSSRLERYLDDRDAHETSARRVDRHQNSQEALGVGTPSKRLERYPSDREVLATSARRFGQRSDTQDVLSAAAKRFEHHLDNLQSLGSSSRLFDRHPDSQDSLGTSARRFDRRPDSQESLAVTGKLFDRHPDGQDAHSASNSRFERYSDDQDSLGTSARRSSRRSEERSEEEADPSMLRTADASSKRRQRPHGSPTSGRQASFARDGARRDGSPRRPRSRRDDEQRDESRSPSRSPDGRSKVREYLPTGDNVRYLVREYEYGDEERERQARGQSLDGPEAWATSSPRRHSRSRHGEHSPERRSGPRARSAGRRRGERAEDVRNKTHSRGNYLDRLLAALDEACRNADSVNLLTVKMKRNLQLDVDRVSNCSTPLHKNTRFV